MRTCWLIKQNRSSCILFFTGWGMDPRPFEPFPCYSHDLLMVYDYTELTLPEDMAGAIEQYRHVHLVAWSMGVWVAAFSLSGWRKQLTTATALNGTLLPIDEKYGIDPGAYSAMIENFSTSTLHSFYTSMFGNPEEEKIFFNHLPERLLNNILDELVTLMQHYTAEGPAEDIFDHHIVGSRDRIFPARHQIRSWGRNKCEVIKAPHFPFYNRPALARILPDETGSA